MLAPARILTGHKPIPLRHRLFLNIIMWLSPAFLLILLTIWGNHNYLKNQSARIVDELARTIEYEHERTMAAAAHLLESLSRMPSITASTPAICSNHLSEIFQANDQHPYTVALRVDRSGDVTCSSVPLPQSLNVADSPGYDDVWATDGVAVVPYFIGRVSQQAVAVISKRFDTDGDGEPDGFLTVGVNLQWIEQTLTKLGLPEGSTVSIIAPDQTVLESHGDSGEVIGEVFSGAALLTDGIGDWRNIVEGPDSVRRIVATRDMYFDGWIGTIVFGVPTSNAFYAPNQILIFSLGGIVVTLLSLLFLTRVFSRAFVGQTLNEVMNGVRRIAANGTGHRIEAPANSAEMAELIQAINTMSFRLETRERERDADRRELLQALDRAESADKAKSAFLSNMSHELRTPLNAIIGYSEMMKIGMLGAAANPQVREAAGNIHTASTHLLALISDILSVSEIQSARSTLEPRILDASLALHHAVAMVMPDADKAGIAVTTHVATIAPTINTDERAFRQIVINLLSNALQASPEGAHVDVSIVADGRDAVLTVRDQGDGIAFDEQPKIFDRFYRKQDPNSATRSGLGIGLYLVKSLVTAQGGTISVVSDIGHGASFTVRFPNSIQEPAEPPLPAVASG